MKPKRIPYGRFNPCIASNKFYWLLIVAALFTLNASAQNSAVRGTVTDASTGVPIEGATVAIVGTTSGTSTNEKGEFTLSSRRAEVNLEVSYTGYVTQVLKASVGKPVNIRMEVGDGKLSEVIVVGFGTQKKATVTGAISSIKTDEIAKSPAPDISNALVGRLPGVIGVQRNAEPGNDGAEIFIRGRATLNDNSPLVLVDGVQRDFSRIDPNQIETMTVLKDASATAIYGVRGANGVILITTKRGSESKPEISYTAYYGVQNPTRIPKYLRSYDFARLYNEAQFNDDPGSTPTYSEEDLQKFRDGSDPITHPDVSWWNETLKHNAPQQRHSLSLSGGSKFMRYYAAGGFLTQDGVFDNMGYKNYNIRVNLDVDVTSSTKFSVDLAGLQGNRDYPGINGAREDGGIVGLINYLRPDAFPVRNSDGSWASIWGANPVAELTESGYRRTRDNTFQSSFILNQQLGMITKGLSIKFLFSYDAENNYTRNWIKTYKTFNEFPAGTFTEIINEKRPQLDEYSFQSTNKTFEAYLNYNRTFGLHEITGLALYTQAYYASNIFLSSYNEYSSSAIDERTAGIPNPNPGNPGSPELAGREGIASRFTYAYDNKYLAEINFGYNGSDNFPRNRRWSFFPSAALGWVISREPFFEKISFVDNLKIRASYGEVGNDRVGYRRFLYAQQIGFGGFVPIGGVQNQTITYGGLPTPNVTWERAAKSNLGIDASFANQLLGFRMDIFYEKRSDILSQRNLSVPATFGATSLPVENIAQVSNKGFELELSHRKKIADLEYNASFNLTYAKNKVLFIDEAGNVPDIRKRTGKPLDQYFGYTALGFYQTKDQIDNLPRITGVEPKLGELIYKDINNDGVIDADDQGAIGKSNIPQVIFGFNFGIRFKGIDFSALLQGATGYNVNFFNEAAFEFNDGSSAMEHHLDRWTPENTNAGYPRLSLQRSPYKQLLSTYWLKDASYLRVKNIELGYTFPKKLLDRASISNLRIYVAGFNAFTFAKFNYWDPEAPDGGGYYYPPLTVYNFGLNLTF